MNKELINKYKPEFDHWLKNPDGLLFYDEHHNGWHNLHCDYQWNCTIAEMEEFGEYGYIINDEYVELRKALAEGKTVQLNEAEKFADSNRGWVDLSCKSFGKSTNLFPVNYYRIKPDEPKFKVGDFVRYAYSTPARALEINNINGNRYYFTNSKMSCLKHELEPWTPIKDEWCWFWDKCIPHRPTLRQYDIFPEGYGEENMFHDSEQNPFDFCEPFLNSRPSHLKDK